MNSLCLLLTFLTFGSNAFTHNNFQRAFTPPRTAIYADITATEIEESTSSKQPVDPKEAVKLFGRLAEKYIMLDASGGMCCYSACSDCEYRLPGGGYIMAEQSAARPKWIPAYETRTFESQDKSHTTKWSTEIFQNGPAITKEEFVAAVVDLQYAPPLGGPYVGASAAKIEDTTAAGALFDVLAGAKEKLTRHKMSLRLKELSDGEEGLNWNNFLDALS